MEFIVFFIKFFIYIFFFLIIPSITYFFVGRVLYRLGFRKTGHYFVGLSTAGDFGLAKKTRKWLYSHCPCDCKNCDKCFIWTCENYGKRRKEEEK